MRKKRLSIFFHFIFSLHYQHVHYTCWFFFLFSNFWIFKYIIDPEIGKKFSFFFLNSQFFFCLEGRRGLKYLGFIFMKIIIAINIIHKYGERDFHFSIFSLSLGTKSKSKSEKRKFIFTFAPQKWKPLTNRKWYNYRGGTRLFHSFVCLYEWHWKKKWRKHQYSFSIEFIKKCCGSSWKTKSFSWS